MIPESVSLNECPIGIKIHKPHRWRGGLFWGTVYGCEGVDQELWDRFEIMRKGSNGTLTREEIDEYLEKYGKKW